MANAFESNNGTVAYTFELARLVVDEVVTRKTVRLPATCSLSDFHQLILKAFRLEDDEVFPGERYADLPYVFYMNNISEDLSCAYVSNDYEEQSRAMDEDAASVFSVFTGMGVDVGRAFLAKIKRFISPGSVCKRPAGLVSKAMLQDFAITTGRRFLYDLGVLPQLMIAVECRKVETISSPADSYPMILPRRTKKTLA